MNFRRRQTLVIFLWGSLTRGGRPGESGLSPMSEKWRKEEAIWIFSSLGKDKIPPRLPSLTYDDSLDLKLFRFNFSSFLLPAAPNSPPPTYISSGVSDFSSLCYPVYYSFQFKWYSLLSLCLDPPWQWHLDFLFPFGDSTRWNFILKEERGRDSPSSTWQEIETDLSVHFHLLISTITQTKGNEEKVLFFKYLPGISRFQSNFTFSRMSPPPLVRSYLIL